MTSWASGLWNQADGQMPRIEDLWKIAWDLRNCSSARCSLFRCVVKLQGRFIFQFLLCTSAVCWDSPLPLHFRTCKPDTVKRSISGLYGSYTGIQFLFPKHAHFGDTAGRGKAVTSCTWTSASPWSTGSNTTSTSKGVLWVCWSIVSLYSSMFFQHKFMMIFRSYLNIYIYIYDMFDPNYWIIYGSCCARRETSQCHVVRCFQKTNVWRWKPCLVPT